MPGLPPLMLKFCFWVNHPQVVSLYCYASDPHLALSLSQAYHNLACCVLKFGSAENTMIIWVLAGKENMWLR